MSWDQAWAFRPGAEDPLLHAGEGSDIVCEDDDGSEVLNVESGTKCWTYGPDPLAEDTIEPSRLHLTGREET